ncbi:MAG: hypothetical protein ACLSIL_07905 [Enterococcus casseliflavus]|uniref:hypothetical protein n=1 Tax=Enterococcus casseliflavus TaxID=37734 RepID=UPI002DBE9E7B|nr:hypothetical protein [Enterococcus casseliflavus]MEB8400880.1 hypothetical protein [Enterococcus casseliflavus]
MDKYSESVDKILSNSDINWDVIIDAAVKTELSEAQKEDVRNLIIATAKIASLTAIKALQDND